MSVTPACSQHVRNNFGIFVLPNTQHLPTEFMQFDVVAPVPTDICIKFGCPPAAIRLRTHSVFGASMPEAAIYEYSKPQFRQYEIRFSRKIATVESEAKTSGMQSPTQGYLRSSILGPLARHKVPNLLR
jgi:hypothetical protein